MTQLTADRDSRRRVPPAAVVAAVVAVGLVLVTSLLWLGARSPRHAVSQQPFTLYTHCGVVGAVVAGKEYVADPPLYRDGSYGNPPDGWGNPTQRGVMTVFSDGTAVFRHPDGQQVKFVPFVPLTGESRACF